MKKWLGRKPGRRVEAKNPEASEFLGLKKGKFLKEILSAGGIYDRT
jgi:hypothetical protein